MTDLVERLRATKLDKDNFPRMDSERWLPVGLAQEAADEIEANIAREAIMVAKIEWLLAVLKQAADDLDENGLPVEAKRARRALEPKP